MEVLASSMRLKCNTKLIKGRGQLPDWEAGIRQGKLWATGLAEQALPGCVEARDECVE